MFRTPLARFLYAAALAVSLLAAAVAASKPANAVHAPHGVAIAVDHVYDAVALRGLSWDGTGPRRR